jgi:hypothetical protein
MTMLQYKTIHDSTLLKLSKVTKLGTKTKYYSIILKDKYVVSNKQAVIKVLGNDYIYLSGSCEWKFKSKKEIDKAWVVLLLML